MTAPLVDQTRRVAVQTDGRTAYEVTTRVVDPGDLPTSALFVVSIAEPLNPRADVLARVVEPIDLRRLVGGLHVRVDAASLVYVEGDPFARVARLADFSRLVSDRSEAVRRGDAEYLTTAVTLLYDDPDTADAAYRQLVARLSSLVTAWRAYVAGFETRPRERFALPTADPSVEAQRRAAWALARDARRRAEAALAAAQAAYDACDRGCEQTREIHAMLVADVTFLERAENAVVAITEVGTHLVQDFVLQRGAYASRTDSYTAMLLAKRAALNEYADRIRACAETCAARRVERDEARAEVARAVADESRAVAAVRQVCPTFVPTE